MTTIDMTGASDAEFEARIAPFEADDVQLAETLTRGQLQGALLPTVQRLIADAEKRAAAAAYSEGWNQATEVARTGLRYEAGLAGGGEPR